MMLSSVKSRLLGNCLRHYSVEASAATSAPPMLVKVRNDMKAAMRAKDTARLDVLRGLIAETTNAAKTPTPMTTDSHMLSLIRKKVKASQGAFAEFDAAGRADLKNKEAAQIAVLNEYIKDSNVMSEGAIMQAIQDLVAKMRSGGLKTDKGTVMKALIGPGGALDGQVVDKKEASRLVDGML